MPYSSSLTDAEWKILEPLLLQILPQKQRTRPSSWTKREIVDGILYQLKNGCNWEDLPFIFSSLFNRLLARAFNGEQQEWLSNWWILYMDKCVNRLKKSQVDNADHHWLPSCQKYLQCRCWLEGVLFLQIDEWNQKASSCWYVGISLLYPLHKSQYLRWCGIDWDVDTQHRLLQVETR